MKPVSRLYIHFADYYHIERARKNQATNRRIRQALSDAMRLAILYSEEVIFPASSFYESPERSAYDATSSGHFWRSYQKRTGLVFPTYLQKSGSSTRVIIRHWVNHLHDPQFFANLHSAPNVRVPKRMEEAWAQVPAALKGKAFVPLHAAHGLRRLGFAGDALEHYISGPIEHPYVIGYKEAVGAQILVDVPLLGHQPFEARLASPRDLHYRQLATVLERHRLAEPIREASSASLLALWSASEWEMFAHASIALSCADEMERLAYELRRLLEESHHREYEEPMPSQLELLNGCVSEASSSASVASSRERFDVL